jgi:hypothetical protein
VSNNVSTVWCIMKNMYAQVLAEDWETPTKILEIQEAISNYMAVWRGLWLNDPSPLVLFKLMVAVNWGAQCGTDEKVTAK